MIRGGRHLGDKSHFPEHAADMDAGAVLEAFLAQHYVGAPLPPVILVNQPVNEAVAVLQGRAAPTVVQHTVGERRVWLEMSEKRQAGRDQRALSRPPAPAAERAGRGAGAARRRAHRCFDISHTWARRRWRPAWCTTTAPMQSSQYRRYNINGITPGDDYAAMRDALTRHYSKLADGESCRMLLLIDGGKGQVGVAVAVLDELGLSSLPHHRRGQGEGRKPDWKR